MLNGTFLYSWRLLFPKTARKSNARKSLIGAMVCIGLSLVPMVVVLTVCNGMINGITERMITLSTSHIRATLFKNNGKYDSGTKNEENFLELSEKIRRVKGVKDSFCEIQGLGLVSGKDSRSGGTVRCVEEKLFEKNSSFRSLFEVKEGNLDSWNANSSNLSGENEKSENNIAYLGEKLARTLNLHAGDDFHLITIRTLSNGKQLPKVSKLKIGAVISSGYQELDSLWVFLPLNKGFSVFSEKACSYQIGIEVNNPYGIEIARTQDEINSFLMDGKNGAGKFYTQKWNEANSAEFENFSSTRLMLVLIMVLIVLVSSVNITSALVMLVMERRKEIAILKSTGVAPGKISFAFLIAGTATSLGGIIFGIPLGIIISLNFNTLIKTAEKFVNMVSSIFSGGNNQHITILDPAYYLQNFDIQIPPGQIILIILGTLVLSVIVSLVPSIKAGKEKTINTLNS